MHCDVNKFLYLIVCLNLYHVVRIGDLKQRKREVDLNEKREGKATQQ